MEEIWDIYDKDRVFQNKTIKRGEQFKEGEYYICCEMWFKNSKGEMLITQRNQHKKAGGLWEFIGGGVLSRETTVQAAIREIKEEIGIDVTESDLSYLYEYRKSNYFLDIYLIKKDFSIRDVVLDDKETINAKWVTDAELQTMIDSQLVVRSVAQRYNLLKDKF